MRSRPRLGVCIFCVDFNIVHVAFLGVALTLFVWTSRSFCMQLSRQMKHSRVAEC